MNFIVVDNRVIDDLRNDSLAAEHLVYELVVQVMDHRCVCMIKAICVTESSLYRVESEVTAMSCGGPYQQQFRLQQTNRSTSTTRRKPIHFPSCSPCLYHSCQGTEIKPTCFSICRHCKGQSPGRATWSYDTERLQGLVHLGI